MSTLNVKTVSHVNEINVLIMAGLLWRHSQQMVNVKANGGTDPISCSFTFPSEKEEGILG